MRFTLLGSRSAVAKVLACCLALASTFSLGQTNLHLTEELFGDDFVIPPHGMTVIPEVEQRAILDRNARGERAITQVDIMVVYDPSFTVRHTKPVDRIQELIDLTNSAYAASGINMQLMLVHSALVAHSQVVNNRTTLDLITNSVAPFDEIPALRDKYGADLVSFIRPYRRATHGSCGVAWIGGGGRPADERFAFSIVSEGADISGSGFFCNETTFAHEIGHNLGSGHERDGVNPAQPGPCSGGVTGYSCGHGVLNRFGTIMTYLRPGVNLFSNPARSCVGLPCGIAAGNVNSADNATSFNITVVNVAAYRDSASTGGFSTLPAIMLLLQ